MRTLSTVLEVLYKRGKEGKRVNRIYKHLFNPELWEQAWSVIYNNKGAMTPGIGPDDTADGMSYELIEEIIALLRAERYTPSPVRRTYIPKKNGQQRPLGLPGFRDKLVSQAIRILLEATWEPRFSSLSYAYRPGRSAHHALEDIRSWTGTAWFIEGDISDCFGSLDHAVMLELLGEVIDDSRMLALIEKFLKAGYLEDWQWHPTDTGAPQGGILSPLLSNIYLDRLDRFVEQELIPEFTRGKKRRASPEYQRVGKHVRAAKADGRDAEARYWESRRHLIPSVDTADPQFRRLRYCRYADDHILGFIGPRAEAELIRARLEQFLREELQLTLSREKTLITQARRKPARFLGYDIITRHSPDGTRKSSNGVVNLRVPSDVKRAKIQKYRRGTKVVGRADLRSKPDRDIISIFQQELRGLYQYYALAVNVGELNSVKSTMAYSMLKTLAGRHRSRVSIMRQRFADWVEIEGQRRRVFRTRYRRKDGSEGTAMFGGFRLTWQFSVTAYKPLWRPQTRLNEVAKRLRKKQCELCGWRGHTQVHQVKRLADLESLPQNLQWVHVMRQIRRLTLMVCPPCHQAIHVT